MAFLYGDCFGRKGGCIENDRPDGVKLLLNLGRTDGVIVASRGAELPIWLIDEVGKEEKAYPSQAEVRRRKVK